MPDSNEKNVKQMADRRKQIKALYSGDENTRILVEKRPSGVASNIFTEESFNRLVTNLNLDNNLTGDIIKLSNYAYATEPNYAEIIDYLSNIYSWRYYYIPVKVRKTADKQDYAEIYKLMEEVVDGMNIENIFPLLISKLLREGAIYLYTTRDYSSKTISTYTLNPEYCLPVLTSQYGTGVYKFDVKFFDDLGLTGIELEEVLELFPDEIIEAYKSYKNNQLISPITNKNTSWVILDGRFSTYIQLNDYNFPKKLSVLKNIFDYNNYRKNELEKSTSELDTVLTHEIPTYEDRILFELEEVQELHKSMARILMPTKRIKLLTTFGKTEVLKLQTPSSVQNNTLERAIKAVYQKAGINDYLFSSDTKEAVWASLLKDASVIWRHVQQIMNFYNLTINNLFNFKGYQIEINMLNITHYNEKEKLELYRRNSEYGVGKLQLIVASGTKQKHIESQAELEEFLKLDEILTPLASSHTQSGKEEKESDIDDSSEPETENENKQPKSESIE